MYEKPEMVAVSGAINYPGKYALVNKRPIVDIILRAGGLTSLADIKGVRIKRPIQAKQIEDLENVNLNLGKKDSIQNKLEKKLKEDLKFATIPVDWESIVKDAKAQQMLFFSKRVQRKVTGNVLLTSEIPYRRGKVLILPWRCWGFDNKDGRKSLHHLSQRKSGGA
jgi:protein involved in polysaccharide export with SLBB domain